MSRAPYGKDSFSTIDKSLVGFSIMETVDSVSTAVLSLDLNNFKEGRFDASFLFSVSNFLAYFNFFYIISTNQIRLFKIAYSTSG